MTMPEGRNAPYSGSAAVGAEQAAAKRQPPPSSLETERAFLGCMMLDREAARLGCGLVQAKDFYYPANRMIFEAAEAVKKAGAAVDVVALWGEMQRQGTAEQTGFDTLAAVAGSVGTSVNLRHYAEEIKRLAYFRRCIAACGEMARAAYRQEAGEVGRILAGIQGDGYGAAEVKTLADATGEYIAELNEIRMSGKTIAGLSTGFRDLDFMLGGLRDGDLNILAARPSMGKSALALDIARNVQKTLSGRERVAFFSLEMPAKSLGGRGYSSEYHVDNDCFSVGTNDDGWLKTLAEIEKNSADFESGSGRMILNDEGGMTPDKIRAACHGYQTQGFRLRLVVVDYLQLIRCKAENRTREIGIISRELKQLAKDFRCPVLALSQLSRDCEKRGDKRPTLSDLRDSGDIEQDADVVMLLYREEYYFPETERRGVAEVNIAKQRNGPTGIVNLAWLPHCTTFRNLETAGFRPTNEKPPTWPQ